MAIPKCWTVWGSRRDSWITWIEEERKNGRRQHREVVRDIFGYQIKERTKVFTNVWLEGNEDHEQRSVQQVAYPHGIRMQHQACLHMDEEEYNCALQEVVSVRAALHFVHLWKRNARMKLMKRARLIFWTRPLLPPAIMTNIFVEVFVGYCTEPNANCHPHQPYIYFPGEQLARCNFCLRRIVATTLSDSSASSSTSEDSEHGDVMDEEIEDYCTEPNTNWHSHRPYVYIPGEQLARCNFCHRYLEHVPNPNMVSTIEAFGAFNTW